MMPLTLFGFPHLIMRKVLVSSLTVDWRAGGESEGVSVSATPGRFLARSWEFYELHLSEVDGREEEEMQVSIYLISPAVLVLWKVLFLSANFQTYPYIPWSPSILPASSPSSIAGLSKYHSLRIYVILLLCLGSGQIRLENQSSGGSTLFLFPEA